MAKRALLLMTSLATYANILTHSQRCTLMSKNKSNFSKTKTDQIYDEYKPIITVKEARKIIGKKLSDQLSDEELGGLIGNMTLIADRLIANNPVPQSQ